ncbi:hypothetical protein [Sphingomonas changnyeongensis]
MIGFGVVGGATRIVWRQRKAREQAEA